MTWQSEAAQLPPPSKDEMAQWADGVVYHTATDGTLLYYHPTRRAWLPSPRPTKSTTTDSTSN